CDLLFPPRCVYCGGGLGQEHSDVLLCAACLTKLVPTAWNGCRRCGSRLSRTEMSGPLSGEPSGDGACPVCRGAPFAFDRLIALGGYDEGLRDAVLRMKRPSQDAISLAV